MQDCWCTGVTAVLHQVIDFINYCSITSIFLWFQVRRTCWKLLIPGIILCIHQANERRRYIVTLSLIGWADTQNDPCDICHPLFHFDLFWPNDTIWRHRYGSTPVLVMACCLTAPSHYLNQAMHRPDYLGQINSMSWLLMPWLLASPGHQQP